MNKEELSKHVASIKNQFIQKAHYRLSSNEQKLIYFLISNIEPKKRNDFHTQTVKVKDLAKIFTSENGVRGSIYERVNTMCINIASKPILVPVSFKVENVPITMHEVNSWFKRIKPKKDDGGEIVIEFTFHEDLKPYLLGLKKNFVQIGMDEFFLIAGKHASRMYGAFKAERDNQKARYSEAKTFYLTYGIDELKAMLGLSGKYKALKDFKRRVLNPMVKEISESSVLFSVDYRTMKTRHIVTGIEFIITDNILVEAKKENSKRLGFDNYIPSNTDVQKLSFSQLKAYEVLTKFGVYEGIAYRQILPTIKGANMEGFEDVFCEQAIEIFKHKEKTKKDVKTSVAVFVNWWTDKKVFDIKGDIFFQISDKVHAYKKQMGQERLDNRRKAKDMTAGEFEVWYKEEQAKQKQG